MIATLLFSIIPPPASLFPPFPFFSIFKNSFSPSPVFLRSQSLPPLSAWSPFLFPFPVRLPSFFSSSFPLYFPLFYLSDFKVRNVQGTYHPRDASFKGRIVQGTHCPRDALSRDRTSETLFVVTSGHSARIFSSRPNWDPSLPHPQASGSPPPLWFRGRDTLACGKGMGGPHSDEGTDTMHGNL